MSGRRTDHVLYDVSKEKEENVTEQTEKNSACLLRTEMKSYKINQWKSIN